MSDTPLIKIPVSVDDDGGMDAFLAKLQAAHESIQALPDAWKDHHREMTSATRTTRSDPFEEFARASSDPKLTGQSSFISKFEHATLNSRKDWAKIERSVETTHRFMSGLAQMAIGFGAFARGVGALGGVGVAAFGAVAKASDSLADKNKSSRSLGLDIGKEQAFQSDYQQFGLGEGDLQSMAEARADIKRWKPLIAAGISTDEIQHGDLVDLTADFARKASEQYAAWQKAGLPAGTLAETYGFNQILSNEQLRTGASYTDDVWQRQHQKYEEDWPRMAVDRQTADQATQFKSHLESNWDSITNQLEKSLVRLAPEFEQLGDAATDLTLKWIRAAEPEIKGLADAAINPHPPGSEKSTERVARGMEMEGDWLRSHIPGLKNAFNGGAADQKGFTADPDRLQHMTALEQWYHMPKGYLAAHEYVESRNGKHLIGKDGKYLGAFQFDEPTAKQYGVDRYDEYSSEVGAAQKLHDLYVKYGSWDKASAAFDGFRGLDADIKRYGDKWREHISEFQRGTETTDYLTSMERRGVNFDQRAVEVAKVSPVQIAQPHVDAKQHVVSSLKEILSNAAEVIAAPFREGAGSRFRSPDPIRQAAPMPAKVNLNVTVSAPAGTNTVISAGGLPQ
jgi:hypothetical protein